MVPQAFSREDDGKETGVKLLNKHELHLQTTPVRPPENHSDCSERIPWEEECRAHLQDQ